MRGRRQFLRQLARIALGAAGGMLSTDMLATGTRSNARHPQRRSPDESEAGMTVTLFLCGDVMLGRGIDQILAHPSDPVLHEGFVRDARRYLALAEAVSGHITRSVEPGHVWGEALTQWRQRRPDVRIINLETSITRHDRPWPKGIHYRMHPKNIAVLTAAAIDCCVLANNHVLDWGRDGLEETLATLRTARIGVAGAGRRLRSVRAPAVLPLVGQRRVLVFAAATEDAGVPEAWAASEGRSGVHRLPDLSPATLARIASDVRDHKRAGDVVVFSVHWGGNWGHAIAPAQRAFAHALVDEAGVDLVHGHSSHHPKAVEVHSGHLILYGCGDFLNDYEGIEGHDEFRSELGLMYFPRIDAADGKLRDMTLVPTRIHKFRVDRVTDENRRWLRDALRREYVRMGCGVEDTGDGAFALTW